MSRLVCHNCGAEVPGDRGLGEIPVEDLVTDEIRLEQLNLLRGGLPARHSTCIATNAPVVRARPEDRP